VAQRGSRRFRLPDFHDIRHMKVVRLSASRTDPLYPQEMFLLHIFTAVPGSIPGGVTGDFFSRGSPDRTMCPEVDSASENEYQGFLLG